ncbi:MAG: class I SAM-dependent methyltransferase, partial [Clostridiales bacterium]|nr:class I SAM-dependent methyltransferase [Clostridiales bacterium]
MNARNYSALASHYDSFTLDVPYETFADFYESQFKKHRLKPRLLLDLACGTGTLTWLMASRGYEMIGADSSCDMLIQSYSKTIEGCVPPIFLNQS